MFNYTSFDESKLDFIEIAPVSELPSGERLFVDVGDKPIVVFNIAGQMFAIGDVCNKERSLE
jgi:nitrite reductase/ring-hydroxylating ferredoxin subunit